MSRHRCPLCHFELSESAWRMGKCPDCAADLTSYDSPEEQAAAEPKLTDSAIVRESLLLYVERLRRECGAAPGQKTEADIAATLAEVSPVASISETCYFSGSVDALVPVAETDTSPRAAEPTAPSLVDPGALTDAWALTTEEESGHECQSLRSRPTGRGKSSSKLNPRIVQQASDRPSLRADYELQSSIGEGGIGIVYAARQTTIDRTVALKMLKPTALADPEQAGKFLAEAIITGELDHPNIVPIYELGANERGELFYSMKRVRGTPWSKVLGTKSLSDNLEILLKVGDAVALAHSRHIIHRDLKPENVMLGDFGEVLVMDWGLALPIGPRREQPWPHEPGMGGTPAYMAPEMATGPLEIIDQRADVYLLGAILYEMLSGRPPHLAQDVMACLLAAARNEIQPTNQRGELVDLALRCMAKRVDDRPASVREFQDAIRAYRAHSESIALSTRAQDDLDRAATTHDYQTYSRAVFAFQEALSLWSGNQRAAEGLSKAKHAYATSALQKGDLDLAWSLLDAPDASHRSLRRRVETAQGDRAARQQRLTAAKRVAVMLTAIVVLGSFIAYVQVRRDRDRAMIAEQSARDDRDRALQAEEQAQSAARTAEAEAERARNAELAAKREFDRAKRAEQQAVASADKARSAEQQARQAAEAAERAKTAETREAYSARIGAATARIEENAFGSAVGLLEACDPQLRRWEWGRLMYLCGPDLQAFHARAPLDQAVFSPDGSRIAAACWDGKVRIWRRDDLQSNGEPQVIAYGAQYVHSVAFSPDGTQLAIGGGDPSALAIIVDTRSGQVLQTLRGHEDNVLSVQFSSDGRRLLTASYDHTARLWDLGTGKELRVFRGHSWWVWSARFAPAQAGQVEQRIVTCSQDGTARVWQVADGTSSPPFHGHQGPVFAAEFAPDGETVASAGEKSILLWQPAKLRPFDFENVLSDQPRATAEFTTLTGHTGAIRALAFSPQGKKLLSASHDNTLIVWNTNDGTIAKHLRAHAGWVRSCDFSPSGEEVLSASFDGRALVWKWREHAEQRQIGPRVLSGHADAVLAATVTPDDSTIITAGRDHSARSWRIGDGQPLHEFVEGHEFLMSHAAFVLGEPDANGARPQLVVTAGGDGAARVWDLQRGVELRKLEGTGRAAALAVSHSGEWLVTGSDEHAAIVWHTQRGERLATWPRADGETTVLAVSPDDRLVYGGDEHGQGQLWQRDTGRVLFTLKGQSARITAAAFVAQGKQLLTASADHTVLCWDVNSGRELVERRLKHPAAVTSLAVDRTATVALSSCADGIVRLWDVATSRVLRQFKTPDDAVHRVAISGDGRVGVTINATRGLVRRWDLQNGTEQTATVQNLAGQANAAWLDSSQETLVWGAVFAPDDRTLLTLGGTEARLWDLATRDELQRLSPHGAIAAVAVSPDGQWIATGSWDRSVKIWDRSTGRAVRRLAGEHRGRINSLAFAPGGEVLFTASDDGAVYSWEVATGVRRELMWTHETGVRCVAVHPAGTLIATGGDDHHVRIWDALTGQLRHTLVGHRWTINSVSFSHDGQRLASGSADNSAAVWNVASGQLELRIEGHSAGVHAVAFSADDARLITGSQDHTAKLWDAATGKELLSLKGHADEVTAVGFTHRGHDAFTASRDGTVMIWPAVRWGWGANPAALEQPAGKPEQRTNNEQARREKPPELRILPQTLSP